jgi:hypothetical protein
MPITTPSLDPSLWGNCRVVPAFGSVSNSRIKHYREEHARDIGERLKYLVDHGWFRRTGQGRGTRYSLPSASQADLFSQSSEHYDENSEHYDANLWNLAAPVRQEQHADKTLGQKTFLTLCSECSERYLAACHSCAILRFQMEQ